MTTLLPAIVAVLYAITAICHLRQGSYALAFVWGCYSLANVGMVALEFERR